MALEIGSQVRQYRLERLLGVGGMGQVYLARDTRLNRLAAIKFLTAPADERARRRLMHEAQAVAALDHPGICPVYEVGTDPAGGDFIAMQYVEGHTLAERLRRGRLPPDEALRLGGLIAEALMAAHRQGLIHRDLKPHNIVITASGAPKVLDFGLATYVPNSPSAADAHTTLDVTDPGSVVGTPEYMAPEQIRNAPLDFRTDVFALGCVLYECLTGRRAFSGATIAETLGDVLHVDPPVVSVVVPELSPTYDALCVRLLRKTPSERFQSAEEVLGAIRALTPSLVIATGGSATGLARPDRRRAGLVAAAVVAVSAVVYALWPSGRVLPVAPAEAAYWHDIGVEALRDGTYAAARTAFVEALRLFPDYPQAYSRLAEAHIALDDERSAREALLQVAKHVPDRSRLPAEDRLRFDAASAAALRQHNAAVEGYRTLASLQPQNAGRWLDVGRAEEAAQRPAAAREVYAKAVSLDGQSAAARLRLGVLQVRAGQTNAGLASIEEAIRLYRTAARTEGETEALLRKGNALATIGQSDAARDSFEQVLQLAAGARFPAQRLGAQFGMAGLSYRAGQLTDAEQRARRAVEDATRAGLPTLAAAGLTDLGFSLMGRQLFDAADTQLTESIRLASDRGATNVEMRARLQQASLRLQSLHPDQAVQLAAEPAKYFKESGQTRQAIDASLILSRANEALEHYDDASRLAADAASFAESAKDDVRMAEALENLAGQLAKLGRLPEALALRQRIDDIHRRLNDQSALPYDLTNHAEVLILMGRDREAADLLSEVDKGIRADVPSYVGRRARVALLRALLASTDSRWGDAGRALDEVDAALPKPAPGKSVAPNTTRLFARVLREHALAQFGRSRKPVAEIAKWPLDATSPADRREWSVWVGQILLARGDVVLAQQVVTAALADNAGQPNHELGWRLAAVAAKAFRGAVGQADRDRFASRARTSADNVKSLYGGAASAYFNRPDLAALLKSVQ